MIWIIISIVIIGFCLSITSIIYYIYKDEKIQANELPVFIPVVTFFWLPIIVSGFLNEWFSSTLKKVQRRAGKKAYDDIPDMDL